MTPNASLPKGSTKLKPIKKQLGSFVEMEYDAILKYLGVTWYRVHRGLSGDNDREDWIADIQEVCVSVHDYQWRNPRWGVRHYKSFHEAMKCEIVEGLANAKHELGNVESRQKRLLESIRVLEKAVEDQP